MLGLMQGWLHSILYVLFENAMSVVKLWAVIAGVPCLHKPCALLWSCHDMPACDLARMGLPCSSSMEGGWIAYGDTPALCAASP